jgi:hypothetical protein
MGDDAVLPTQNRDTEPSLQQADGSTQPDNGDEAREVRPGTKLTRSGHAS